jgi:HK97 family phage major capsid protein
MNRTTAATLMKFKDQNEQYIWQNALSAGQPPTLLGYPVYEAADMPDVGANATPIAFGNWRLGYLIVDRIGIRVVRDPYTKPGWVRFYIHKRVGGAVLDSNAVKLQKIST